MYNPAMRNKYIINGKEFNSKQAVLDYVKKEIHSQYAEYVDISIQHLAFMVDLLRNHTYADQKIGNGVKRMWLQRNAYFPTRGFWLEREDGTTTDFSYIQCLQPASMLRDFKEACRSAVAAEVIEFKEQQFRKHGGLIQCPISKNIIHEHESHVDHAPPYTFNKIVNEFIQTHHIDVNKSPLADHTDGKIGNYFTDIHFEDKWVKFHNERAKLRILSASANLSLPKR